MEEQKPFTLTVQEMQDVADALAATPQVKAHSMVLQKAREYQQQQQIAQATMAKELQRRIDNGEAEVTEFEKEEQTVGK